MLQILHSRKKYIIKLFLKNLKMPEIKYLAVIYNTITYMFIPSLEWNDTNISVTIYSEILRINILFMFYVPISNSMS